MDTAKGGGREFRLLTPSPTFVVNGLKVGLHVKGLDMVAGPGEPEVPAFLYSFEVPAGMRPTLSVAASGTHDQPVKPLVAQPGWTTRSTDGENFERIQTEDGAPAIYQRPDFWPPDLGSVTTATIGTQTFARVRLNPLQYQPVAGIVRHHESLVATLAFEPAVM